MQPNESYANSRVWKYATIKSRKQQEDKVMDQFRETTLEAHVEKCQLRYELLEHKLEGLDARLTKVETDLSAIKAQMHQGFGEIKLLLEKQSNARVIQLIATAGTIGAAVVAAVVMVLK